MTAVVHFLPQPLLRVLDAWSHRIAQRRARERQRKWLARVAKPVVAAPTLAEYRLRPWRD